MRCQRYATTVLVVDASVLAVALADDGAEGDAARARLDDGRRRLDDEGSGRRLGGEQGRGP
jgi:hypothetical protein